MKLYSVHNIDNDDDDDRNHMKLNKDTLGLGWVRSVM